MGQLFVAISRVRHPSHVCFDPVPSLERISTIIARKASLKERKEHEALLRCFQKETHARYRHLHPDPQQAAASAQVPLLSTFGSSPPAAPKPGKTVQQLLASTGKRHLPPQFAAAVAQPVKPKRLSFPSEAMKLAQELACNEKALDTLGLRLLEQVYEAGPHLDRPSWLDDKYTPSHHPVLHPTPLTLSFPLLLPLTTLPSTF